VSILGPAGGRHIHALSHHRDPRPIVVGRRRRSIGAQRALGGSIRRAAEPEAEIDAALVGLVDRVTRRMRKAERVGRTVTVRFRFEDFTRATRSHTLHEATAHTPTILRTARTLVAASEQLIIDGGLTLIGIAVSNLDDDDAVQLSLPFDHASLEALDVVVDDVHARFGNAALQRAVLVHRDPGIAMPMLPD
jgi:DNA polymerase-4